MSHSNSIGAEALTLSGDEQLPTVKVRASAIFSILTNYIRRNEKSARVIGTLVGTIKEGNIIEVTDCFCVPHQERVDELYVAVNTEYHKSMFKFHNRIYKRDVIVGWFTTTLPNGALIVDNSSLIHDFYRGECPEPIHLVVDTTLAGDSLAIHAFVSQPMVVGLSSFANIFQEIKVQVMMTDGEISCLYQMIKNKSDPKAGLNWESPTLYATVAEDPENLTSSIEKLSAVIDKLLEYVNGVVEGKHEANIEIGIAISNILDSSENIRIEDFYSNFKTRTEDLLLVSYINTLTQTQLSIADKLSSIL